MNAGGNIVGGSGLNQNQFGKGGKSGASTNTNNGSKSPVKKLGNN